ncbi:efflux RND transporter periplasmic adaptor subunit [Asticcacaulis solisilvae]|uniref:efflux RND transporter periplasmic adaptor subunit n=1 Tax=Asticcacaulis solisilvae TaxID=1217274 RepID=UPI003FD7D94F
MFKRVFSAALLLTASLAVLAGCGKKDDTSTKGAHGPASVGYVVVQPEPVDLIAELSGRTSAFLVSDVRPQVGGIVKARQFTEGGVVSAGQPLYQIDPAQYQAAYDSALANQQQAQAGYELAHTNASRAQQLITIRAISQSDFDTAQADEKQKAATLAQSKAAAETAKINLDYTHVTSPIAGRIGKSSVTPGALVTANQTTALATVQDISKVYVDITQSATEMLRLKRAIMGGDLSKPSSAKVQLILDDGTAYPLPGTLEFTDVSVSPSAGTVTLRALFPNPDGLLMPGMFVRARVIKGVVDQALMVPQGAVTIDPKGGATVLVAGDDGKAHARRVTAAEMIGTKWRIAQGLQAGDKVIVEGAMRLKDGGPIKARPVQPDENAVGKADKAAAPAAGN